ncbi:hypothetical protein DRN77_01230 [Methanosarcinales archaeon]|nr:MAG: hypothetical protein DRN77_01230 [Methanosarcinales archaeon]
MTEEDVFFDNRRKIMFIVNVLVGNTEYIEYMRSKGLSGVQISDIVDMFKNLSGAVDESEIVQTIDQLLREGLLISRGGGTVINPNPPISVDSEGIEIKIETVGYEDVEVQVQ